MSIFIGIAANCRFFHYIAGSSSYTLFTLFGVLSVLGMVNMMGIVIGGMGGASMGRIVRVRVGVGLGVKYILSGLLCQFLMEFLSIPLTNPWNDNSDVALNRDGHVVHRQHRTPHTSPIGI